MIDYNATCKRFHELDPSTIVEISRRINEKRAETEMYENPDLFHSNFMTELQFDSSEIMSLGSRTSSNLTFIGVDQEESFEASMVSGFESELCMSGFGGHSLNRRTTYDSPDVLGNFQKKKLDPTEEELKFKGKLVYLREQIKPPKFVTVNREHKSMRSRCPIICASGFLSQNKAMDEEWQAMTKEFPFTEIVSLQWDSSHIKEMVIESADLLTIFLGPVEGIMAQGSIMAYRYIDNLYQRYTEPKEPSEEHVMAEEEKKHQERMENERRTFQGNSLARAGTRAETSNTENIQQASSLETPLTDQQSILDMEFNYSELELSGMEDWEPENKEESSPKPMYNIEEEKGTFKKLGTIGWGMAKTISGVEIKLLSS